jgi:tRNA (guanine-N7-)-methyltransferase
MNQDERAGEAARRRALYGRRKGKKLRAHQTSLMSGALPRWTIDLSGGRIDPDRLFARGPSAQLEVEIGFGGGERLARAAALAPDIGFIGCEPFENGVAKLLVRIEELGLSNILLHVGDGAEVLAALPSARVDRVHLLYPDPWPKRRQRKRRFVDETNLAQIARVLRDDGEFRFATDIDDYAAWTLARATRCPSLQWRAEQADDWRTPWPDWPGTRYEAKARVENRAPVYLTFSRTPRSP